MLAYISIGSHFFIAKSIQQHLEKKLFHFKVSFQTKMLSNIVSTSHMIV
jgi:hypothetical protein